MNERSQNLFSRRVVIILFQPGICGNPIYLIIYIYIRLANNIKNVRL